MTDSNRLARLLEIVRAARELPPEERQAYVRKACAGDPVLLEDALYELESDTGDGVVPLPAAQFQPGDRIGEYVIQAFIGRGGFGEVYRAEQQGRIRRPRVALKLLRPERDRADVLARFRQEWLTLAVMEHPGIAKVLDVGATEEGRPFFVMEYVDGKTLMRYCDDERLSVEQRLELFRNICSAVEHAHQKGVIHRDLKPSNILVSTTQDTPEPKIIDFGVAKALDPGIAPRPRSTVAGQPIGTLPYMAPEQAGGLKDIDTRADLYSLGVVLYELLTGRTPFEPADFEAAGQLEMLRFIREEEPLKPSEKLNKLGPDASQTTENRSTDLRTLMRKLREDLDWVAMRCLEKDRDRRYSSAGDLASEINRYLDGQALLAGPPSRSYRLGKFVRRNRGVLISTGLIGAAILAGIVATTRQYVQAGHERELRAKSEQVVNAFRADELAESAWLLRQFSPGRTESERAARAALELVPAHERATIVLARIARSEGDMETAEQMLRDLANRTDAPLASAVLGAWLEIRDPEAAAPLLERAQSSFGSGAILAIRAGVESEPECADALFSMSLEHDPWNFETYWDRSMLRYNQGQFVVAADDFTLLATVRPDRYEVWVLKGLAESEVEERLSVSERSLARAIDLNPKGWIGYYNRGRTLSRLDRSDEAIGDLETARKLAPDEPMPRYALGLELNKLERWKESMTSLEAALERDPDHKHVPIEIHARLGQNQLQMGDFANSAGHYTIWLEADPASASAEEKFRRQLERGHSYLLGGNLERAESDFDFLTEEGLDLRRLDLGWMQLRWKQHRFTEALPHAQMAYSKTRSPIDALQFGLSSWFAGRGVDGIRYIDYFIQANEGSADADWVRIWLAGLQRDLDRETNAETTLKMAASSSRNLVASVAEAVLSSTQPDCSEPRLPERKDRLYCLTAVGLHNAITGELERARKNLDAARAVGLPNFLEHDVAEWARWRIDDNSREP